MCPVKKIQYEFQDDVYIPAHKEAFASIFIIKYICYLTGKWHHCYLRFWFTIIIVGSGGGRRRSRVFIY